MVIARRVRRSTHYPTATFTYEQTLGDRGGLLLLTLFAPVFTAFLPSRYKQFAKIDAADAGHGMPKIKPRRRS
jgi:hypothetical protein